MLYFTNYLAVIFMKYKAKNVREVMGRDQTLARVRTREISIFSDTETRSTRNGAVVGYGGKFLDSTLPRSGPLTLSCDWQS